MTRQQLQPEAAYLIACRHALRDGVIDEEEARILEEASRRLDLPEDLSMRLKIVAADERDDLGSDPGALEPEALYHELCALAREDGAVDIEGEDALLQIARVLRFPDGTADRLFGEATPPPEWKRRIRAFVRWLGQLLEHDVTFTLD